MMEVLSFENYQICHVRHSRGWPIVDCFHCCRGKSTFWWWVHVLIRKQYLLVPGGAVPDWVLVRNYLSLNFINVIKIYSLWSFAKPPQLRLVRSQVFVCPLGMLVFLYQALNTGKVVLFSVDDKWRLPGLRVVCRVNFCLHLKKILAIQMTVHYSF